MKILLAIPPTSYQDWNMGVVKKTYQRLPSLGLGYLAAVLENAGHEVRIYNGPIGETAELSEMKSIIRGFQPEMVGFGAMTPAFYRTVKAAEYIKKNIDSSLPVVIGGSHVSSLPIETLGGFHMFDAGILGEGEMTTLEYTDCLSGKKRPEDVKGIVFRKSGKAVMTKPRPLIQNLDTLPFPARHLMDLKNQRFTYFKTREGVHMLSSRGCPYRCKFCDHAIFGKTYRTHSTAYIISEIKHVIENYHAREIIFLDDNFTLSPERVFKLCDAIIGEGIDIQWQCFGRVNNASYALYRKMERAGCWTISFGIESGNQQVLDFINKDITLSQVRTAVRMANKAGLLTRGSFMIGHPIETRETALQTIEFAKSLPLDNLGFSTFVPYPGSQFYTDADKYGTFRKNKYFRNFNRLDDDPVFVPSTMTKKDLISLREKATRDFFLRPRYMLRAIRNIQSPKHFARFFYGFLNIILREVLGRRVK